MLVFITDEESSDTDLPILGVDPLTDGQPAGAVPFLFDLFRDFSASHADAAYEHADVIADLSETADGSVAITSAPQTITSGALYGGMDFSAITDKGNVVAAPAGALGGIHAGDQYFAVAMWVVLPEEADWNGAPAIAPFFCTTAGSNGYTTPEPDLLTIAQLANGRLTVRRQTDGGSTAQTMTMIVDPGAFGELALIMYWRNAAGVGLRVKTAATDKSTSDAVGNDNSGDFSTKIPQWGVTYSFNGSGLTETSNYTLLRGWIENLEISGRNPAAIFSDEWDRVTARVAAIS